jgi:acetyl-CoA acetyltransferase
MNDDVAIIGIGMTRFGRFPDRSLRSLGVEAITAALTDAKLDKADIDMAFVANSMSGIITGQAAIVGQTILRAEGFSGIPVFNIDNACAGSSSALSLAVQAIRSRSAETVLVLGVEKLVTSDMSQAYRAINGAVDPELLAATGIDPLRESVFVAAIYPPRLAAYAKRHALAAETLADIAVKNRAAAFLNPLAQYKKPLSRAEVLSSRNIVGPITTLMCAPIGDGAAAVVVTRRENVRSGQLPVWIAASVVGMGSSPGNESSLARLAALAYAQAGVAPQDVDVAEVHDSIAFNELVAYEELGFAAPGGGTALVEEGETALGGRLPVNTSGGLESRGHPIAATGLAQIFELVCQLREAAGARQVSGARVGLAENAGGFAVDDTGAIAVTILRASGLNGR